MYMHFMIGLLAAGSQQRRDYRPDRHHHRAPADMAGLSDHELRDVGYLRERVSVSYRHLLWM